MTGTESREAWLRRLLVLQLVIAALIVGSAVYVLAVASWTTIVFDQWRIYDEYFSLPFPRNVLTAQNGHHPVLPGLLFLADIHWFGAHNYLLNTLGVILAAVAAALWSRVILRDRELDLPVRGMCVGLVWVLSFWLANGRVLAHGNESLHVYPVLCGLFLAVGALLAHRPGRPGSPSGTLRTVRGVALVVLGCLVATYSFGLGLVTWPIVVVLAWMLGYSWRVLAALTVAAAGLVASYFALPAEDVPPDVPLYSRGFQPFEIVVDATVWLGSPAFHGLRPLHFLSGDQRMLLVGLPLGAVGLAIAAWTLVAVLRRRGERTDLEIWTLALLGLGVAGALLVAYGRGTYFDRLPQQRVAPRYLPWVCTFWAATLVSLAIQASRMRRGRITVSKGWMALALALPLILLPTHHGRDIEFAKHRMAEAGVGLAAGVRSNDVIQRLFRRRGAVARLADHLAERDLAMFEGPIEEEIGQRLEDLYTIREPADLSAFPADAEAQRDRRREALRFWGRIEGRVSGYDEVVVVDDRGMIAGRGTIRGRKYRWARDIGLLATIPPQYGGYVVGYRKEREYTVYALSSEERTAVPIAQVPSPTSPGETKKIRRRPKTAAAGPDSTP
jgi:hypothetical protein